MILLYLLQKIYLGSTQELESTFWVNYCENLYYDSLCIVRPSLNFPWNCEQSLIDIYENALCRLSAFINDLFIF